MVPQPGLPDSLRQPGACPGIDSSVSSPTRFGRLLLGDCCLRVWQGADGRSRNPSLSIPLAMVALLLSTPTITNNKTKTYKWLKRGDAAISPAVAAGGRCSHGQPQSHVKSYYTPPPLPVLCTSRVGRPCQQQDSSPCTSCNHLSSCHSGSLSLRYNCL